MKKNPMSPAPHYWAAKMKKPPNKKQLISWNRRLKKEGFVDIEASKKLGKPINPEFAYDPFVEFFDAETESLSLPDPMAGLENFYHGYTEFKGKEKEMLRLYVFEGLSLTKIQKALGTSEDITKRTVNRLIKMSKTFLSRDDSTEVNENVAKIMELHKSGHIADEISAIMPNFSEHTIQRLIDLYSKQ